MVPYVHPTAEVEEGASIGEGSFVWRNAHIRTGASIGDGCVVGGGAFVDTGVRVGNRVKIENQAMLFAPAQVDDGVFIGPGACLTNDVRPRAVTPEGEPKRTNDWEPHGVEIRRGASIGAMAVVLPGVVVGAWAMVGAGAVVTSDVPSHALFFGNPARFRGWICRDGLALPKSLRCVCGRTYERIGAGLELRGGPSA